MYKVWFFSVDLDMKMNHDSVSVMIVTKNSGRVHVRAREAERVKLEIAL